MKRENEKNIRQVGLKSRVGSFFKQDFFRSKIVFWLIIFSLVANVTNWMGLWILVRPIDGNIILHYNVYFGVDMMGNWKLVFIMPSVGLLLFLINFFLALYFYHQKERIASYILLLASLMIQLSLLVASVSIIIINY